MVLTKKEEKKIIKRYKEGMTTKNIASELGVNQSKVSAKIYHLQQLGILPKKYSNKTKSVKPQIRMNKLNYTPTKTTPNIGAKGALTQQGLPSIKGRKMLGANQVKIAELMDEIKTMLLAKNVQYGDSALQPVRVFSTADTNEQIKVRIDDKINRIVQGNDSIESDEDVIQDLIGYLVLLLINMREWNSHVELGLSVKKINNVGISNGYLKRLIGCIKMQLGLGNTDNFTLQCGGLIFLTQ